MKHIHTKKTRPKGFTLVELIVVLVIFGILLAVSIPSIVGFVQRADQTARMDTARSLFLAAQTALQEKKRLGTIPQGEGTVDTAMIYPALETSGMEDGAQIVYLSKSKGEAGGSTLFDLLLPFVADPEALSNAILLEYDQATGIVLSVFYSDARDKITYTGSPNIYDRGEETCRKLQVGYYGVLSTSVVVDGSEFAVGEIAISLVDYDGSKKGYDINFGQNNGLLVAECRLPEEYETVLEERGYPYQYTVSLKPLGGGGVDIVFGDDGVPDAIPLRSLGSSLDGALSGAPLASNVNGSGANVRAYIHRHAIGEHVLVLVIDSLVPGVGIAENFPMLGTGYIGASFTVEHVGVQALRKAYSNTTHSLFGGEGRQETEAEEASGTQYTISSVRHLNNIRKLPSWSEGAQYSFVQTKDILAQGYLPGGQAMTFARIPSLGAPYEGGGHTLKGIVLDAGGLFGEVTQTGRINALVLDETSSITGDTAAGGFALRNQGQIVGCTMLAPVQAQAAGGIAAQNEGTIANCRVAGNITGVGADSLAGGIAAQNEEGATVAECYVGADVSATAMAGGIVAENAGLLSLCEVGTAAASGPVFSQAYFGATAEGTRQAGGYLADDFIPENDVFTIDASARDGVAGGIAATQIGTSASTNACVNAARVVADAKSQTRGGTAGGLIGAQRSGALTLSYNAGFVEADGIAGGLSAVTGQEASIDSCYNTAAINVILEQVEPNLGYAGVYDKEQLHVETALSGGMVGLHGGSVQNSYSIGLAAGGYSGGVGISEGEMENCYFLKNVLNVSSLVRPNAQEEPTVHEGLLMLEAEALALDGENPRQIGQLGAVATRKLDKQNFGYPYPLYQGHEGLAENFHRTPWQAPLDAWAYIENLTQAYTPEGEQEGGITTLRFGSRVNDLTLLIRLSDGSAISVPMEGLNDTINEKVYSFTDTDSDRNYQYTVTSQYDPSYKEGYAYVHELSLVWSSPWREQGYGVVGNLPDLAPSESGDEPFFDVSLCLPGAENRLPVASLGPVKRQSVRFMLNLLSKRQNDGTSRVVFEEIACEGDLGSRISGDWIDQYIAQKRDDEWLFAIHPNMDGYDGPENPDFDGYYLVDAAVQEGSSLLIVVYNTSLPEREEE